MSFLSSLMSGAGNVGQALTPQMAQAAMAANPGMTPDMLSGATVAGAQSGAPAAGSSPGLMSMLTGGGQQGSMATTDPMQMIMQGIQQQNSPMNTAMQGLMGVGQNFINKNVMQKQLMPAPGPFGMTSSQMGPLQLSPLLNYLKGLG